MSAPYVLHIIPTAEWESGGPVEPESLATEGFVHCSDPEQVLLPARALFAGRRDLSLLVVDVARLSGELVYEDCYTSGMEFPHVYAPIERDAVVAVFAFPPEADGGFALPADLVRWLEAR